MLVTGVTSVGRMETCLSGTGEEGKCVGTDGLVLMRRTHQKPCLWPLLSLTAGKTVPVWGNRTSNDPKGRANSFCRLCNNQSCPPQLTSCSFLGEVSFQSHQAVTWERVQGLFGGDREAAGMGRCNILHRDSPQGPRGLIRRICSASSFSHSFVQQIH